jgi:hypothetical protein
VHESSNVLYIKIHLAKKKSSSLLLFMYFISKIRGGNLSTSKYHLDHHVSNRQIHCRRTLAKLVNKHKKDREKNKNVTTKGYLDT